MKPGIAIALLAGVGAFFIASQSANAQPRIPPLPGKVPPIPPAPPSSPPASVPRVQRPPAAPPFTEPGDDPQQKVTPTKTNLAMGRVVELRGIPNALYQIVAVEGADTFTGELLDPVAFGMGTIVGLPNLVSFHAADVLAIAQ